MHTNTERIDILKKEHILKKDDLVCLLSSLSREEDKQLFSAARAVREQVYGKAVFLRGLIEFTNICRNDCLYCGIRKSNPHLLRYRLSDETILDCCRRGHDLGFRTFVLQGGEDLSYTDEHLCSLISAIKSHYPDCALTLSIGEKSRESYQRYYDAGADRYLLRHETIDPVHYSRLHPSTLSIENRVRCLRDLKEIGFQTGCGIMVGSPYQTLENIADDLLFMHDFRPHMVGIGPFIPHKDTPFRHEPAGTLRRTLQLLAITRLMLPDVLLPATTALGTIDLLGREKGILAGANVVMPNLSPEDVRSQYILYDGKIGVKDEAAANLLSLKRRIESIGYYPDPGRGDHI